MNNIAINALILDDEPTGLGIYAINVVRELQRLGKFHVITSHGRVFSDCRNVNLIAAPAMVQPKYKRKGALARFFWINTFLPRLLANNRVSLLLNLTHHGLFFSSIPQIVTVHDLIPLRFPGQYKFQYIYFRMFLGSLLKRALAVNTCSSFTKSEIMSSYGLKGEKVIVTGNSYNPVADLNARDRVEKERYFLLVGATFPHKNIHTVIKAYGESNILRKEFRIKVVGCRKGYCGQLASLASDAGILEKIDFIKYADTVQLKDLYLRASLLVYPSLYEGFGMPPLEAMNMGLPVAASRIGAIQEVCGDAAWYFDPYSADDIRKQLETILSEELTRRELIRRGIARAKQYTWEKVAQGIYDYLQTIEQPGQNKWSRT